MPTPEQITLVRGQILHFLSDPGDALAEDSYQFWKDGALLIRDGHIADVGDYAQVQARLPVEELKQALKLDYSGRLVIPGLVDTHCHYPQCGVIASYGRQLLDWLNDFTFPAEAAFRDPETARATAEYFVERLLAHGTTTASVFSTVHPQSVDAFMEVALDHDLRMLSGKVMMDRNAPDYLCDSVAQAERDCMDLIERWHGRGRLRYSITPRFAPTSTPRQLELAGRLYASRDNLHIQTHLSENLAEIAWVKELFPDCNGYLDVYHRFGLLGARSIYAHCIHLNQEEIRIMSQTGSAVAFCPTSNTFLGSGYFRHAELSEAGMRIGLATDVGGGTSFSMLQTMGEAYKISQHHHRPLPALRAWYLATLGGAQALYLDEFIGNFEIGKEADFIVVDPRATPELEFRLRSTEELSITLFALMILGDERCIKATHIMGTQQHKRCT